MDHQTRITDLIPKSLASWAMILLAGFGLIAGLEVLYLALPQLTSGKQPLSVAAFDLAGPRSVALWLSSSWLALAGMLAMVVYGVRNACGDDETGGYRVWMWAAMCCFLMSLEQTSNLRDGFKTLMIQWTGRHLFGDGAIWWLAPYFFLFTAVGLRLLAEVLECKSSTLALVAGLLSFTAAGAAQFGWLPALGQRGEAMLLQGTILSGDFLLVMAMGLHARFVILQTEDALIVSGSIEKPVPVVAPVTFEPVAPRAVETAETPDFSPLGWLVDPAQSMPPPTFLQNVTDSRTAAGATVAAGQSTSNCKPRRLTKTERKAMRKRLEELRREREDRLRGG